MQIERPNEVNQSIDKLLIEGTVAELKSEKGRFLRLFMTADEVYRSMDLPMHVIRGFDGTTCDDCRGDYRFTQCRMCHGCFDNLAPVEIIEQREAAVVENAKKNVGPVRAFFDRWKEWHATR